MVLSGLPSGMFKENIHENLIFEKDSFELLQDILEDAGELGERAEYEELVQTEYAKNAVKEK